ncbi:MAG TPA: ATP-dependent RecD-like DNA helicase [Kiritimatiellia bacterium]|mgnify:CR=1 FL=1|nr:ATP-dependent RecD-like DNA helicase [Kiritimatiellia bacterium]
MNPPPSPQTEHLEGTVERVTFHSEDTGFCVLRVNVKGAREPLTVVGKTPNIVAGEVIRATGQWITSKQHGRQFQADTLATLPPDSLDGIKKFLGSGLIKGIGPVYAAKMVKTFGKQIFDIIDKESARLEEIEGIGRVRRLLIKEGWNEARDIRSIMAFLMAHGAGTSRAFRIYKTYGDQAIANVQTDPYCLARDIRGIGFKTADAIAERVGIAKDSPLRARAGVEHVLTEWTNQGHCACPPDALVQQTVETLGIPEPLVLDAIEHGLAERRLLKEHVPGAEPLIYLTPIAEAEKTVAERLHRLLHQPHPCPDIDLEKAIPWLEAKIGITLADAQRSAVRSAATNKVLLITGGPGVGKTTVVNAIIRMFHVKKRDVVLAAPTGRAAKRMTETTGTDAKTLHRLLAFDPRTGAFKHDARNPLPGDVFIFDETSMVDLPLAASLLKAIPDHAILILVGDADQLPSVGPGAVLKDLLRSDRIPLIRLTHIFRQAAQSDIVTFAHAVNHGQLPDTSTQQPDSDLFFITVDDPPQLADRIVHMVRKTIPEKTRLDPLRDIQVLSPMQRGTLGARALNQLLQDALNPRSEAIEKFGQQYRVGDKIMQLENDYDKDVFNGDMGKITRIDHDEAELHVDFGGRIVAYPFHELDELAPAYAITIHKSQGSEYPCVIIPVHTQHFVMLQRNLIYTAVTRGKQLVILVGTKKALAIAVQKEDARQRLTTLTQRLIHRFTP